MDKKNESSAGDEKSPSDVISPEMISARSACLDHADDLLAAAKAVHDINKPNIAYHLATLALEEVGKAGILFISQQSRISEESQLRFSKHALDHVKKLFWAFFGGSFGERVITKEMIETSQQLAAKIHEKRLHGLYVDIIGDELLIPSKTITNEEAHRLIELTSARLGMEKSLQPREITSEESNLLSWFMESSEDTEKMKFIVGKESMQKLVDLRSIFKWIMWLKETWEKIRDENLKLAERELKRPRPEGEEARKDKWKMKIRIYSSSHTIRPKALNYWNKISNWIKLYPVSGKQHKNELIVEFIFPKALQVDQLWYYGWGVARRFVTALNIGSLGFFWWYLPQQVSRYYESLIDLETRAEMRVERSPMLKLGDSTRPLGETELENTILCFASIPTPSKGAKIDPFNYYIGGLTFMGINDIHWQCESNAYVNFYKALKTGMKVYEDCKKDEVFSQCLERWFSELSTDIKSDIEECFELGEQLEGRQNPSKTITLEEVGKIKIFCDFYFLKTFRRLQPFEKSRSENNS